jgi:hypothetical protein
VAEPEIRIKIKSTADNKGVDDSRKSFADFAREIPGVGRALELIKNPVALLIGLFTGLAAAVKGAVAEFAQAEVQSSRLDAALARSGQLTDAYRESLHDLASQMQQTTGIADDQWFAVIRKLTQFGANEGNIGALTDGVKNLAGIMDGDLQGAATLVARALQGNFEVMSRYGIEAKNVTDLLKELSEKGQGQLEARTKTLIGTWENLKNQLNDLREGIGGLINRTGLLKASIDFVAGAFQFWVEAIGNVQDRLPGLTNAVDGSAAAQEKAAAATKRNAEANAQLDTHLQSITENLKAQNDEIDKRKSREDRVAAARERAELADIDASDLSPAQKEFAKLEVTERYANAAAARENARVAAIASNRVGAINELGATDARLAREERQLGGRIGTQEQQDRRNRRIEEARNRLEEINPQFAGYPDELIPHIPMLARLDAERNTINRFLASETAVVTTTAQDRARLADIAAQRQQIGALRGTGISEYRAFERDMIAEFDTRQVEETSGSFVRSRGAQGRVGGMLNAARDTAAQGVLAGQADEAVQAVQGIEQVFSRISQQLVEAEKRMRDLERNNRDQ